jgi:hypothetical protein
MDEDTSKVVRGTKLAEEELEETDVAAAVAAVDAAAFSVAAMLDVVLTELYD